MFWDEMLCICQLWPFGLMWHLSWYLLISSLDDIARAVNKVLRPPTLIVFWSLSPFSSVSSCFIYFRDPWLGAYTLNSVISSWCSVLYHYKVSIFVSCYLCYLEIYFVRYKYGYTCFSVDVVCLEGHFPSFHFESTFVFSAKCVSWRQHMVGFVFWPNSVLCASLLVN